MEAEKARKRTLAHVTKEMNRLLQMCQCLGNNDACFVLRDLIDLFDHQAQFTEQEVMEGKVKD